MQPSDPAPCPSWCVSDHSAAEDHRGNPLDIAVIELRRGKAVGETLLAQLHQSGTDERPWLYVGDGFDQHLEISIESARRVATAIAGLLP